MPVKAKVNVNCGRNKNLIEPSLVVLLLNDCTPHAHRDNPSITLGKLFAKLFPQVCLLANEFSSSINKPDGTAVL